MHTTPVTLLERLGKPEETDAWQRFVELYTPLLFFWARRTGLQPQDAADLVQEVFVVLVQKLPEFSYDRERSFRGWLRTLTLNKWRDSRKRRELPKADGLEGQMDTLVEQDGSEVFEEEEYRQHVVGRALELMQDHFQLTTWKACWEHIVSGKSAEEVADELGITVGAVYAAKFRVLARLREDLTGLLE